MLSKPNLVFATRLISDLVYVFIFVFRFLLQNIDFLILIFISTFILLDFLKICFFLKPHTYTKSKNIFKRVFKYITHKMAVSLYLEECNLKKKTLNQFRYVNLLTNLERVKLRFFIKGSYFFDTQIYLF